MTDKLITFTLWAFVINLGVVLGAGLYESRIEAPRWLSADGDGALRWNRDVAVAANVGLRFWVYVSTIPLTLLTLGSLVLLWQAPDPVRGWWMAAALVALIDRTMTFSYFIPSMLKLMTEGIYGEAEAAAKACLWLKLAWVRHAADLAALAAGLQAFASWHARSGR
ncbi:MAG: DUF1772 domain-containing protein [Fibrobacteria bacterium]